jgi:hypothetical protein
MSSVMHRALANADLAARQLVAAPNVESGFLVTVALGDPQAPVLKLFEVLSFHGLLSEDGWLKPSVRLVSAGDHFDFGSPEDRTEAQQSGLQSLAWLAAHSAAQVILLIGNHDLARVGELINFEDTEFDAACVQANESYARRGQIKGAEWRALEASFVRQWPALPSIEVAARYLSAYLSAQRDLVRRLLIERRFRMAFAAREALLCHAGITQKTLRELDVEAHAMSKPEVVADALNRALDDAVDRWDGVSPFEIERLHRPGSAKFGEGVGILLHRPAHPDIVAKELDTDVARRYDPRDLPIGLTQVVGHIRDTKCRQLLGPWVSDHKGHEGQLRTLLASRDSVSYTRGITATSPEFARMIFVDGGLNSTPAAAYELADLDTLQAFIGLPRVP